MGVPVFLQFDNGIEAYRAGNFGRAIDELSGVIEQEPRNWEGRLYLAMSFYKLGRISNAVNHFGYIKDNCPDIQMRARAELAYKNVTVALPKADLKKSPPAPAPQKPVTVTMQEAAALELLKNSDEYYDKK